MIIDFVALAGGFAGAAFSTFVWRHLVDRHREKRHARDTVLYEEEIAKLKGHPYRDPAALPPEPLSAPLYPYDSSKSTIEIICPMCGGLGLPKACACGDHPEPHLHQTCDRGGCGYRYAMQSRTASKREKT